MKKIINIALFFIFITLLTTNLAVFEASETTTDTYISNTEAKATAHYKGYLNRTFHRGCKEKPGICELSSPDNSIE